MNYYRKLFIITLFLSLSVFYLFAYITAEQETYVFYNSSESEYPDVIIDAGHGGEDGGAVSADGTVEKDINLSIALQTRQLLKMLGINVLMIRTDDNDLADHSLSTIRKRKISDIKSRYAIMQENPNAVYVSIHQNQFADRSVCGLQVFYSDNHAHSKLLADFIQQNAKKLIQAENARKAKPAGDNIYLLYHADIPAVMVECGFMSNPDELKKLKSNCYGTQISLTIIGGLINYYNHEGVS